jgi:DsbC/DsbD-like thiol-disulfide interchange protein
MRRVALPPAGTAALAFATLVALSAPSLDATAGAWFETPESRARLVSRFATAAANGDAGLGVEFRLAPGWHVYWKNAGDAGYAPEVAFASGPLGPATFRFPAPARFDLPGDLVAFGYEEAVVYPVDARLAPTSERSARIAATLDYLVCAESCIPYRGEVALELPVAAAAVDDPELAPLVDAARARLPTPAPAGVGAELESSDANGLTLEVTFAVAGVRATAPDLFFEPHPLLAIGRPSFVAAAEGPRFRVPVRALDPTRPLPDPLRIAWVATGFEHAGRLAAWEGELEVALPRPAGLDSSRPLVIVIALLAGVPVLWLILRRARAGAARPTPTAPGGDST